MNIRAVIFDMDGVLVDSEGINVGSVSSTFEQFGYPLSPEQQRYIIGRNPADFMPYFTNELRVSDKDIERIQEATNTTYQKRWDETITLIPKVYETIQELLNRNKVLTIATSGYIETVKKLLKKFDLEHAFTLILAKHDVAHRKPHPEIYLKSKERLGLPDDQVLVVEDTALGVEAAKSAGLLCAAIPNQYTNDQDFSQADRLLSSMTELLEIVN